MDQLRTGCHLRSIYRISSQALIWLAAIIGASLSTVEAENYRPGEVLVLFDSTAQSAIDSAQSASQAQKTVIGIAAFDSIGVLYHLQSIQTSPQARVSVFARRMFVLIFPSDAPAPLIAGQYARLPFVMVAEPNFVRHITAETSGTVIGNQGETKLTISPTASADTALAKDKQLIVRFSKNYPELVERVLSAARTGQVIIGDAAFDSISTKYKLKGIRPVVADSGGKVERRAFILVFPPEANLKPLIKSLAKLPYVQSAKEESSPKVRCHRKKTDSQK